MALDFPSQAEIVIIGAGIVGCSTAYHLAKNHGKDVVVIERGRISCGSTFHAAGLVGQLRSSASITRLLQYSTELYGRLEAETGASPGWKQNGGLRLAGNVERWTELCRQATTARGFGLEMEMLSPREARDLWPLMDSNDLYGAAFFAGDGQASPGDVAAALARGARHHGARIFEETPVTDIRIHEGRVAAVVTEKGPIACEKIVNCAGQWAREVGAMAGVNVPLQSVSHQYLITEPIAGVTSGLPTLRDPDGLVYFKEEVGGLVMGGYEPNPQFWGEQGFPPNFIFSLLEPDWPHFEQLMAPAIARVPMLAEAGIRTLINGPESFTPDGNFILGEAPAVRNFFVGAGFNAFGIAAGGGAGWALAEWVADGEPPMDLWVVDIRRFGKPHQDPAWVRGRTAESYAAHYAISWPAHEAESSRGWQVSPLYEKLKMRRACFGSKMGWERPNWFAPAGVSPVDEPKFGRPNWFMAVAEEHRACRERAALFDLSSFSKFIVAGADAEAALARICANDISKPPGALTYTQMLNPRGGIQCDLTVARLAADKFYIVTGTANRTHDSMWIRRRLADFGAAAKLSDETEAWATLALMGPRARDILSRVSADDLSPQGFPFGAVRQIHVADVAVRALRVTFVGELGWELHIPAPHAVKIYDALCAAGEREGLADAGYRAVDSLRLEKGYRVWGTDITPADSPFEAGLGRFVKLGDGRDFIGREAALRASQAPPAKRLCCFTVAAEDAFLYGGEAIWRDGKSVGWLTSGGWGHTVGKAIGYGYVRHSEGADKDYLASGTYQLEIATQKHSADIHFDALYDPAGARIKS